MKRELLIIFLIFLLFGIMANSFVLADQVSTVNVLGDDSGKNIAITTAGESEGGAEDEGTEIRERERERIREEFTKEFRKEFTTPDGVRVRIERSVEFEGDEVKIKIKKVISDVNGSKREIEIEIERDGEGVTRRIEIEGQGFEIDKEIVINDLFEGNETELEAVLSDGNKTKIKMPPERVRERVRERLRNINASNISIQLKEKVHKNIPRVVYNVQANQHGRFLGIFKLAMKVETDIDPETGDVIKVKRPWWAFLVSLPESDAPETNETA